jgi:hypothetical protein
MRFGTSRTCGIFANEYRSRLGPGSGRCSTVKAPVGIGKVEGITVDAPFPSLSFIEAAEGRFDLGLVALGELGTVSGEFLDEVFGAVVFAITLFLCSESSLE